MSQLLPKIPRGRILVAKVGLDGHDRGAKVLSRMLRDAGFEVIYLGVRSTVPHIARVALEEWVDAVAISLLSGAHIEVASAVRQALDAQGLAHVPIAMGGLIPTRDERALAAAGVMRAFHPGHDDSSPAAVAQAFDSFVDAARARLARARS